ncbi:thioredoxin domain-containing protein 9-like [Symsagittifera roscoffensis]|uniref:thioredoxin domain-containing protein 9-like n=1 Tax=Symsagittifera roscoffensis TaxID=84072 RepID=UPI00307B94D5
MSGHLEAAVEASLLQAAQVAEQKIDDEIKRLEEMDDEGLEQIRQKRLAGMKKEQDAKFHFMRMGHGTYREHTEHEFLKGEGSKSDNVVIHFYRPTTERCQIVDRYLHQLAPKYYATRFCRIDAEKAKFLCDRLKITVIPSIACFVKKLHKDTIVGFDDLGGRDDFPIEVLEWRLGLSKVINYTGDCQGPIQKSGYSGIFMPVKKGGIRGGGGDSDDDDD